MPAGMHLIAESPLRSYHSPSLMTIRLLKVEIQISNCHVTPRWSRDQMVTQLSWCEPLMVN